jgi:hypothetical protein
MQLNRPERKFCITLNYLAPSYLKHFEEIVNEILDRTTVNFFKFNFLQFSNQETFSELLDILIRMMQKIENKKISLELNITT